MKEITIIKISPYIPSDLYHAWLTEQTECAFLDSSLANELGQFSILGAFPYQTIEEKDGFCYSNGEKQEEAFLPFLKTYLAEHKESKADSHLPFVDGGICYFSYDYGRGFEYIKTRHKSTFQAPAAWICFFDCYLIEDVKKKEIFLCTKERLHTAEWYLSFLKSLKKQKRSDFLPDQEMQVYSDYEKEAYLSAIDRMKEYMRAGDVYVANMTRRIYVKSEADPLRMFHILREYNPAPFGAYFSIGDTSIICASPERYLKLVNGHVKTRPIKGTRKRGETREEDLALKEELAHSDKDKSELLMIVDLERNDLNRICKPHTVKVPEMYTVETYATVFHLVSEIHGVLREEKDATDLLYGTFPGGSITGTPKIRAMEIIDELEQSQRGLYTGSIGYISFDGNLDLNIVIRTAVHHNSVYEIGVGGGITVESDCDFEYEETNQKAKALIDAIHLAEKPKLMHRETEAVPGQGYYFGLGLFETMHLVDGSLELLSYHLNRMSKSAVSLGLIQGADEERFRIELRRELYEYLHEIADCTEILKNGVVKAAWSDGVVFLSSRVNTYREEAYQKGFVLEISSLLRNETSPFTYHKSLNYGDNIVEKRRAHEEGFDEPVFLNSKGEFTEGAVSNLFLVIDGEIHTPPVRSGLLNGTIRQYLLDEAGKLGFVIKESVLTVDDLARAEEAFVTNALMTVMPVRKIGKKEFSRHSAADLIRKNFF